MTRLSFGVGLRAGEWVSSVLQAYAGIDDRLFKCRTGERVLFTVYTSVNVINEMCDLYEVLRMTGA